MIGSLQVVLGTVRYNHSREKTRHDIIVIFMNLPFCKMNQQSKVPPRVQEVEKSRESWNNKFFYKMKKW